MLNSDPYEPLDEPEDHHRQLPDLKDRLYATLLRALETHKIGMPPGLISDRWFARRSGSLVRPHVLPVHPRDAFTDVRIARAEAKRARRRERNLRNLRNADRGEGTAATILAVVGFVAVIALVGVGGYLGGWWLTEDSVNRQARIDQDSYSRQNALVEQILDDVREAEDPNVPPAQRTAIIDQICDSAAKLTGAIDLPFSTQTFITQECN